MLNHRFFVLIAGCLLMLCGAAAAQVQEAPERTAGEGPYDRLIIRGVTLIDGTGAPPRGPMDIVVEGNRIASVHSVGYPGMPIEEDQRPRADKDTKVLDAAGMYLLPGFIDMHAHTGGEAQGTPAEYVYKLWMAHGITTVRESGSFNGMDWTLRQKERSRRNEITAPRIFS